MRTGKKFSECFPAIEAAALLAAVAVSSPARVAPAEAADAFAFLARVFQMPAP